MTRLFDQIEPLYEEFLVENFPEYRNNPNWEVIPKLFVSYETKDCEAFIQTPEHLYQYSLYYEDLYLVDGESYFLMDEQSRWNRKPRESNNSNAYTGTGSYGSGGSGGASGYSYYDADDYADEYAEEYMEEGFGYEDAYDEAYDDWED